MGVLQLYLVGALLVTASAASSHHAEDTQVGAAASLRQGPRRLLQQAASHTETAAAALGAADTGAPAPAPAGTVSQPANNTQQPLNHGGLAEALVAERQHKRAEQAASAAADAPAPDDNQQQMSHNDLCSDHPPPGKYGCDEQRDFDKCFADFMVAGDFCRRTCGRCVGVCNDIPPPGEYTCEQQQAYGKCDEHYIRDWGYCAATCGRCDEALAQSDPGNAAADGSASDAGMAPAAQAPAFKQAVVDTAVQTEPPTAEPTAAPTAEPTSAPTAAPKKPNPKQHQHKEASGANMTHVVTHVDTDGDDGTAVTTPDGSTVVVHEHSIFAYVHGILMVSAFGGIIPLGIFVSRYGKFWGGWFQTHRAVQTIGWLVATAGFVLALTMHKISDWWTQHAAAHGGRRLLHAGHDAAVLHDSAWQARHRIYLIHKYVGISVFVAVTLQALSLFARPGNKSRLRSTWAWGHFFAGWGALAVALFNNWEGLVLLQPLAVWWFVGYGALVAVIVGWVVIAEVRWCIYGHQLEGYKQAGENGDLELVGGSYEEREGLTGPATLNGGSNGEGKFDLEDPEEDDDELAFVTSKYAKD